MTRGTGGFLGCSGSIPTVQQVHSAGPDEANAQVPSSGSGDSRALTIMALGVRTADRLIARLA